MWAVALVAVAALADAADIRVVELGEAVPVAADTLVAGVQSVAVETLLVVQKVGSAYIGLAWLAYVIAAVAAGPAAPSEPVAYVSFSSQYCEQVVEDVASMSMHRCTH